MYSLKSISCVLVLLLVTSDLSAANIRLCGQSLAQFLDVICVDGFNSKNLRAKKSDTLIDINDDGLQNVIRPSAFSSLFMDKLYANQDSLLTKNRRRRHDGVADECCRKSCKMSELLSYCQ